MKRIPQFSIWSLILVTAIVALALILLTTRIQLVNAQMKLAISEEKLALQEQLTKAVRDGQEAAFFGHHKPPVLTLDPKQAGYEPQLKAVYNSRQFSPSSHTFQSRRIQFTLTLLRTIGDKDYYRLSWRDGNAAENIVLFEYDGTSKVLVNNDTLAITLAPGRKAAIATAASVYGEQAEALKEKWSNLQVVPTFIPAARPAARNVIED